MRDLDEITGAIVDAARGASRTRTRQTAPDLLKLAKMPVGLLINFGAPTLREGLRRLVNGFQPSASSRLRVNQRVAAEASDDGH